MTRPIGFSTGALARGDFRRGLRLMHARRIRVIELSALREQELQPLLTALDEFDLSGYDYISFHSPGTLREYSEAAVSTMLRQLLPRRWPIVIHPDVFQDRALWQGFGECLCIENMDKRKRVGRSVQELEPFFADFPEASFCFDIGHACQVDPTMTEAAFLLRRYGSRLKQVHLSEVNSRSGHDAISFTALQSFRKVADLIPPTVPIILETAIPEEQIHEQMQLASAVFAKPPADA